MISASAIGTLADTPLAHALVYARNRRLSGRIELATEDDRKAAISLWRGRIAAVETTPVGLCPGGFFGAVAYELGFIDSTILDETLLVISKTKRLHGEVLIERKAISREQRDEALIEQVHRRIHYLFGLPESTSYTFWDARSPIEPPIGVDLVGPVWRGIRDYPPVKFVTETVRRIGDHLLRININALEARPRLPPVEAAVVDALAAKPMTLATIKTVTDLPPARVDLLIYLLVIAKHVEAVSGVRTHPSTGALPMGMPSGPVRSPGATSSTRLPVQAAGAAASPPPPGTLAALRTPADLGLEGVTARARAIESEDYFQALGVAEGASAEAVRAAYLRLTKSWHPDRLPPEFLPVRADVATVFSHMTKAQRALCDPETRRVYVASRNAKVASRPRAEVMRDVEQAFAKRSFELVMQLCQQVIDDDHDDAEALALQAWASVSAGEATEDELRAALAKMERAVNVDRTSAPAIYHRGLVQKRLGNVMGAFRDFARALQIDPTHAGAEREVRLFAMRARKGSGEHKLAVGVIEKLDKS